MKRFELESRVRFSPEEAWQRITDWARHGDHVPFTTIAATDDGFVARTRIGPLTVDDPMRIVEWDPPHRCRLVKTGRVVLGDAEIVVEPSGTGARVVWREGIRLRGVPAVFDPVLRASGRRLFRRVIDRLLAD